MVNNIASIFLILKLTVFRMLYLITTLLTFYRISIILFTLFPMINFTDAELLNSIEKLFNRIF